MQHFATHLQKMMVPFPFCVGLHDLFIMYHIVLFITCDDMLCETTAGNVTLFSCYEQINYKFIMPFVISRMRPLDLWDPDNTWLLCDSFNDSFNDFYVIWLWKCHRLILHPFITYHESKWVNGGLWSEKEITTHRFKIERRSDLFNDYYYIQLWAIALLHLAFWFAALPGWPDDDLNWEQFHHPAARWNQDGCEVNKAHCC